MSKLWTQYEGGVVDQVFPLQKYLGGGDNSGVFLTEHGRRKLQKAAIKLIPEDPRNGESQLEQWRLAEKLSHPHLMRILDVGRSEVDGKKMLYVVMDYADEDLSQVLPNRALSADEVLEILEPALDVLNYIHNQGFVHGHLKPSNFMAVEGGLRLSSDGLTRMGQSRDVKPDVYAPPEIMSEGRSPASDVWALGMTLVEALTQRLPVTDSVLLRDPVIPNTLPEPLFEIARNCLRWDPHSRWTLKEISKRLHGGTLAVPERKAARGSSVMRRWIYISTGVLAAALAGIAIAPRMENPRPEAPRAPSVLLESQGNASKPQSAPAVAESPAPDKAAATPPVEDKKPSAFEAPAPLAKPERVIPPPETRAEPKASVADENSSPSALPGVVRQSMPETSAASRNTITGKVAVGVKVSVDQRGNVVDATFDPEGPSRYFARQAMDAAKRWKFAPSNQNGNREWILTFHFRKTDTKVIASRVSR